MASQTIAQIFVSNPLAAFTGAEKGYAITGAAADTAYLFSTLKTYMLAAPLAIPGAANTSVLTSTGYSLTGTDATNMVDLAGTWNTSGNPTALKIAITNTASGATSKFVSLLAGVAGATEVLSISKAGNLSILSTSINTVIADAANPAYAAVVFRGGAAQAVFGMTTGTLGQYTFMADYTGAAMRAGVPFGWSASSAPTGISWDLQLNRKASASLMMGAPDAAAPVAQSLSVQSVVAGTTNTAGADWNITGSLSTGSGIAGKIIFNLSQIVAAATAQNASSSVLALNTIAASGIQFPRYGAGALSTDASGNITATSDERLKRIEGTFDAGLEELMGIEPILYKWTEESGMETEHVYAGLGAGNVRDTIPEAVGVSGDGYLTLSDRALLAACVNAIKQLATEIRR